MDIRNFFGSSFAKANKKVDADEELESIKGKHRASS